MLTFHLDDVSVPGGRGVRWSDLVQRKRLGRASAGAEYLAIAAVSYTHLDVYKRQDVEHTVEQTLSRSRARFQFDEYNSY